MSALLEKPHFVWLTACQLCLALTLSGNETKSLDADQMQALNRRVHQDLDVLTCPEYDLVLSALFDQQLNATQAEELYGLAFLSLIRDSVPKRVAVAAKYAEHCEQIIPDGGRLAMPRSLAVMLEVLRFDAPVDGPMLEDRFWKSFDGSDALLQNGCLMALQFISWQSDACATVREAQLVKWFEHAPSDQVRLGIIGCISGATDAGKCHPHTAIKIYRALLKVDSATPSHADAILSQIQDWFAEMQLRAIFSGMSEVLQGQDAPSDAAQTASPHPDDELDGPHNAQTRPERLPTDPTSGNPPIALDGNCPVTLVDQERWKKGDTRWQVQHDEQTFLFAGPAERETFLASPKRYAPSFAGRDIVLAKERSEDVAGKRQHGLRYRDQLLLFSSEDTLQRFWDDPQRYMDDRPIPTKAMESMPVIEEDATAETQRGQHVDRVNISADLSDQRDLNAIHAAVEWLKQRNEAPLDVEVKLSRREGSRLVHFVFVFRNDQGEPHYVVGGMWTVTVSESGEITDVVKGA